MSNKFLKGVDLNEGRDKGYFIPNLVGEGAPSEQTEGATGVQYMDTQTGKIYICTAVSNGTYIWELLKGEGGSTENAVLYTAQILTEEQKTQARENIGACQIDNTTIGIDAWSSQNIVDKLCPSFTESGSVVACTPVEGYPLGVEWKTKNLINPVEYMRENLNTTLDGDVFTTTTDSGTVFVNNGWLGTQKTHPAGTYTLSIIPVSNDVKLAPIVYLVNGRTYLTSKNMNSDKGYSMTFTANEEFFVAISGGDATMWGTHSYKLQLEVGTTATAYEPYAETATIYRGGKNLLDSSQIVIGGISGNKGTDFSTDTRMRSGYIVVVPGQSYIVSGNTYNIDKYCYYDVDKNYLTQTKGGNQFTAIENARYIRFSVGNDTDPHTYTESDLAAFRAEIQIEVGTTATEYEPYNCDTFAIGEPIIALKGVNTIYADKGLVTVTGKADPDAVIKDLYNKLNSLSATMTALMGV